MEQFDLLRHLISVFESINIRYFVTGSIASMFYGEPRFTNDIDVVAVKTMESTQKKMYSLKLAN